MKTLDENTSLVERMLSEPREGERRTGEASVPPFVSRALLQMQEVSAELENAQTRLRQELEDQATDVGLSGSKRQPRTSATAVSVGDAWQFQREHLTFLQKEERRRRAVRVERHNTDASSRQVMIESFPARLEVAQDISVWMGSATVPEVDNEKQSREQTKKELVLVLSLKRRHARADEIAWLDTTVHAYRELLLSPYFQQYLGCHEFLSTDRGGEDHTEHLYCFELAPVTTLEALLASHSKIFEENSLLVRYFAREILLAMIDFHEQCTHTLQARLTPQNVLLSPSRRRILLGKLEFGASLDAIRLGRSRMMEATATREKELLGDLAVLLFSMFFQKTLPANLDMFRAEYLPRVAESEAVSFANEFVFSDTSPETTQLRVSKGDRFSIVLLVGCPIGPWLLKSSSPLLEVWEQTASPVPTFTFVASHPGEYQVVFVPLTRGLSPKPRVVVDVSVDERSYLYDPPSRISTLIQNCTQLSLRGLLDTHEFFDSFTDDETHALDLLLEQCSE